MPRIDLFTSPECPSCPRAREVVAAFAAEHPDVELHEWDLATNPGPAVGRGIFVTPSVLLNGVDVLVGVPKEADLLKHFPAARQDTEGAKRILVLNAYEGLPLQPPFESLSRAGYIPCAEPTFSSVVRRHLAGVLEMHPRRGSGSGG